MTSKSIKQRGRPRDTATHQAILDAASDILETRGYSGFSIERVASQAGVSKTSIYRRWASKGELLLDLYMIELDINALSGNGENFRDALEDYLSLSVKRLESAWWRSTIQSLVAEAQGDEKLAEAMREKVIHPRREAARVLIQKGIDDGTLRADIDFEILFDMVFGAMWYRLLIGHSAFDRDFAHSLVDQLFSWIEAK